MATSGTDILTRTANEMIKDAFVLINVLPHSQSLSAVNEAAGINCLNAMIQDWTTDGVTPWRKQTAGFSPLQGQSEYVIAERPLEVIEMRWVNAGGTEIPLTEISHDAYFDLPNKMIQGTPSQFYVRRNRTDTSLFLWPVPAVITGETIGLTYNRRTEIVTTGTDEVDVPQEWLQAVKYNLATYLGDEYGAHGPVYDRIQARATAMYESLKMYEREGVVGMSGYWVSNNPQKNRRV